MFDENQKINYGETPITMPKVINVPSMSHIDTEDYDQVSNTNSHNIKTATSQAKMYFSSSKGNQSLKAKKH